MSTTASSVRYSEYLPNANTNREDPFTWCGCIGESVYEVCRKASYDVSRVIRLASVRGERPVGVVGSREGNGRDLQNNQVRIVRSPFGIETYSAVD